jgi:antibiotic biosynthesis monooxygenase (ABM) superfamily enzyme
MGFLRAQIEPMVEGEPTYRQLEGLEAWFRDPHGPMPPRWKMPLLTWIAVWPVSMLDPAILMPLVGPNSPQVLTAGLIAARFADFLELAAYRRMGRARMTPIRDYPQNR